MPGFDLRVWNLGQFRLAMREILEGVFHMRLGL
jgi:hypothetical protein